MHVKFLHIFDYLWWCLSVCLLDDNFRKPWCRKFIFAPPVYPANTDQVHISRSLGQGHRSKKDWKYLFPQWKTLIDHNSSSITDRATRFACSTGLSADRMAWPPSLSHDWKWPHVTTLSHKNTLDVFSCNSWQQCLRKHCRIFIIFGRNITEKVSNQKVLYFSTSPN